MLRGLGVRLGYSAGTGLSRAAEVRDEVAWADEVGFHSFWLSQIFGVDPLVALAAVGSSASRLEELGTSVVPLTGRHPLALAAQARTLQSALEGRFTLGIGASHQVVSEGFFGEPYANAFARTREFLAALMPLLAGEPANVEGAHIFAKGWLEIEVAPVPVLLAALGPQMLDLAGRVTEGTSLGSCGPRTISSSIAPVIRAAAHAAGRPDPRIVALVGVCVTDDVARLRANAREQNVMYDSFASYRRALDHEGVESGADLLVAGGEIEIIDGLRRYVDAGVTDLRISIVARTHDERAATKAFLAHALRQ